MKTPEGFLPTFLNPRKAATPCLDPQFYSRLASTCPGQTSGPPSTWVFLLCQDMAISFSRTIKLGIADGQGDVTETRVPKNAMPEGLGREEKAIPYLESEAVGAMFPLAWPSRGDRQKYV